MARNCHQTQASTPVSSLGEPVPPLRLLTLNLPYCQKRSYRGLGYGERQPSNCRASKRRTSAKLTREAIDESRNDRELAYGGRETGEEALLIKAPPVTPQGLPIALLFPFRIRSRIANRGGEGEGTWERMLICR